MSDKVSYVSSWTFDGLDQSLRLQPKFPRNFRFQLVLLATLAFCILQLGCSKKPIPKQDLGVVPKTLVLGFDGIGYDTFRKLQEGGHFRFFSQVSPMVATFPSISDPNWTKIFGLPPEPSFTKAYYDPTIKNGGKGFGGTNGNIASHVVRQPLYERVLNFGMENVFEHLSMFVWTDTTALYWMESIEKDFLNFRGRDTYFALVINSDLLSHTEGEKNLMKYLVQTETKIEQIMSHYKIKYGQDLEVILVSDHGNAYFSPLDVEFEPELKAQGWSRSETIAGDSEYGFYVPEILSFGAFYANPHQAPRLAQAMAKVKHVHITAFEDESKEIHLLSDSGKSESILQFSEKSNILKYRVIRGRDPFNHLELFKKGALASSEYFQRTLDTAYPNALARLWESFNRNSQIRPHVLVSPDLGYVFSHKGLRILTDMKGFASSHGSLHRDESMGVVTSTRRQLPAIRPQDFGKFVNVKDLALHHN